MVDLSFLQLLYHLLTCQAPLSWLQEIYFFPVVEHVLVLGMVLGVDGLILAETVVEHGSWNSFSFSFAMPCYSYDTLGGLLAT